ncbi:MAG: hypothetical protein J2P48_21620 [Alphaproteobacteria bacterium]|nr:hypothetical protein [Alphaproteobacteria bacterium]
MDQLCRQAQPALGRTRRTGSAPRIAAGKRVVCKEAAILHQSLSHSAAAASILPFALRCGVPEGASRLRPNAPPASATAAGSRRLGWPEAARSPENVPVERDEIPQESGASHALSSTSTPRSWRHPARRDRGDELRAIRDHLRSRHALSGRGRGAGIDRDHAIRRLRGNYRGIACAATSSTADVVDRQRSKPRRLRGQAGAMRGLEIS